MVKHILIVDDQPEVRRVLRAGIETLDPEFVVLDLPSAEESLVVISIQPVDLLITDIGLPGMSGLDLMEKIRKRNPGLKLILITGLPDPDIRSQLANSGTEAFFIKPIPMGPFLDAVETALGARDTPSAIAPPIPKTKPLGQSLPALLADLRQELEAESVILLDDSGEVLLMAGDLLGDADDLLIPTLISTLSAANRLSSALNQPVPENLLCIKGRQHNLCAINAGADYALLVLLDRERDFNGNLVERFYSAVQETLLMLETHQKPETLSSPPELRVEESNEIQMEGELKLEELLQQELGLNNQPAEIDEFWENLAQESTTSSKPTRAISYDLARKLGLVPEDNGQT